MGTSLFSIGIVIHNNRAGFDGTCVLVQSRSPSPVVTGLLNLPKSFTGYSYEISKLGSLTCTDYPSEALLHL
jgi:hypothetical protein